MLNQKTWLMAIGLLAFLASGQLAAQQFARPDGTNNAGSFTAVNAGTHHDALNEVTADDNDYIDSGSDTTIILSLSDVSDPGTYTENHIIRWRCQATNGSKKGEGCHAQLYQGGTLIDGNTNSAASRGSFGTLTYTIPDASAITDYSALEIRLSAVDLQNGESIQISWVELEVPGAAALPPTVDTPTWTDVTDTTATLGGRVFEDGGATVTSRGIEWGTTQGSWPNSVPAAAGGVGVFTVPVTGLPSSSTIYFRAWATNTGGTGYSAENSFTTNAPAAPPTVTSPSQASITATTAVLGGNVTEDGGASVTDRGIVWNTTSPAQTGGTSVSMGSGLGEFSALVSSLPPGTLIYYQAYATNSAGTSYSTEDSFTTLVDFATLAAPSVTNIAETSADLGGEVLTDGGGTVSQRGIIWNTSSPPETGGTVVVMGSGLGSFSQNVPGLPNETLVYFRAFADNEAGRAYSSIDSFTPSVPKVAPTVDTPTAINITHLSADLGGNISSDGGLPILERGTVWHTASPVSNENQLAEGGTATGTFSHTRTPLPAGTTIYFKAYATNSEGTGYSGESSFVTETEPTVQASNITFPRIGSTSMRISWDRGNGEGSIVVLRATANTRTDPQDGDDYTGNSDFSIAPLLPGDQQNKVVYKGTGTSVHVTGLLLDTFYSVAIYEFTGSGAGVDYLQLLPAEDSRKTTLIPVHNEDFGLECDDCHSGHGSFNTSNTEQKAVCETCHNPSGVASGKLEFDLHLTPNKNPAEDFVDCGYCHELHNHDAYNTTSAYNPGTDSTQTNKSFLRANVDKYVETATADDAYLHNDTYDSADPDNALTPERAVEGGNDTTARGYCQVCHSLTNYHRSSNTAAANQCHDGEGGEGGPGACLDGDPEIHCGKCHQHNNKFIGVGGSQTCHECHQSAQGSRPIITTQFDRLSHHYPGAADPADCEVCHDQSGHTGGQVILWDVDNHSNPSFAQPGVVPGPLETGEGEAFAGHCLSCHDGNGVGGDLTPFSNGTVDAPTINAVSWAASSHDRDSGTFPSSPVTCVGDGTNGCHSSGHGSEKLDLLGPNPETGSTPPNFPEQKEGLCYNCHSSGGSASSDIESIFASAPDPQLQDSSGSKAPINQRHDINYDDQTYSGAVLTCKDCHDPHVDSYVSMPAPNDPGYVSVIKPGTSTLIGTYSPSNSYSGGGDTFSYDSGGNLDPINPEGSAGGYIEPDYIQFCLTCHDGDVPTGVVLDSNMVDIADAWTLADVHGAGDNAGINGSTNKGGMKQPYVTASAEGQLWDATAPYAAMNCNTCHGAHGSNNIFNLKESITVGGFVLTVGGAGNLNESSYNGSDTYVLPFIDGKTNNPATGNQTDHYWGAWCTFCHQMDAHPGKVETDSCTNGHMHGGGAF